MLDAGKGIYGKYSSSMVEKHVFLFSRSISVFIVCGHHEKMFFFFFFFFCNVTAVQNMISSNTDDLNYVLDSLPSYLNHRIVFFWQSISRDNEKRPFCGHKTFFTSPVYDS